MSFDTYQAVTDEIAAALERGVVPWHKPWNGGVSPQNLVSRKAYRGVNVLLLSLSASAETPYWLTFKQAKELGGHVRAGERGSMVVFFKRLVVDDPSAKNGKKEIPLLRYYRVFNVAQCERIDVPATTFEGPKDDPNAAAESVIAEMPNPPAMRHGGSRAYYSPAQDVVQLPERQQFESLAAYYATAFHELTHSTGHESRLARFDEKAANAAFGSLDYGKEELTAELGTAFLCNAVGIDHIEPSASYIDNWLRAIKSDRRLIVSAASKATAAADYIQGQPS